MLASAGREALASGAGLEPQEFQKCLGRSTHEQIDQDVALADQLKVTGTPTFMIGWRVPNNSVKVLEVLRGAQPLSKFEEAITRAMYAR
jgi:protein-disulfide isomerase